MKDKMELGNLWENVLGTLRVHAEHGEIEIWFKNAVPVRVDGDLFVLSVPNPYYCDWIDENYRSEIEEEMARLLDRRLRLLLVPREPESRSDGSAPTLSDPPDEIDPKTNSYGLNPSQTFDSFVVGECNKFSHAAASAVSNNPARNYNPLFIYGATGLGKTHLMHAIGNRVLETVPDARIFYVTAEDFMNEMIDSLRYKRMEDFRNKYRKQATVLLVDDIQFLSGKERTQEEFFHTFNALKSSGRQIVLTSDVVPKDIEKLEPRLRTRFEGGLLSDLQPPDKETMLAIIRHKAEQLKLDLPADLADAIANKASGNIREVEGILNRIEQLHGFYKAPITLDFARTNLSYFFTPVQPTVTVAEIIAAVARIHGLRSADLIGGKRSRTLTGPRHIAMFLARMHTNLSFPELGREFGDRDHSTIQHGFHKVEAALKDDADLQCKIRLIEQHLGIRPSN